MRIQTKLTFLILFILLSFVLVLLLFYYTSSQAAILAEKEKETILLGIDWLKLVNLTNDLLINDWKIEEMAVGWSKAIDDFEMSFNRVIDSDILQATGEHIRKKLAIIRSEWSMIKGNLIQIKRHLDMYIAKGIPYSQRSLLFLYGNYYTNEDEREKFYQLSELNRLILNFQKSQVIFTGTLTFSAQSISDRIAAWRNQNLIIAAATSVLLVTFSLLFSWVFAHRIADRIGLVRQSIERVSRGDFTTELNIRTNDEFEVLSRDYNEFIKTLKSNVDSVLDFMTHMGSAVSSQLNIPRLLTLIADSAVEDTNASAAAILMLDEKDEYLRVEAVSGLFPPPYRLPGDPTDGRKNAYDRFLDTPIQSGETILGQTVARDASVFIKEEESGAAFAACAAAGLPRINSLIAVPLKVNKKILGVIAVAAVGQDPTLTDLDFTHLKAFADYAAISIENLLNVMKLQAGLVETIKKAPNSHHIINKVRVYLENNYHYQLMVDDVAQEMSVSPSHFKRIFKRDVGYTFTNYLNMLRIQKAKELLLTSAKSITDIAFSIGYNDSNYFSTVFKQIEGVSPREFRKKMATSPVIYMFNKKKKQTM